MTESVNPIHCYKRKQPQTEKLLVHNFFMKGFTETTDPNIYPFAYFHSNRGSFSPAILANPPLKRTRLKSTHSINTPYQLPLYPSMNTHFRPTIRSPGHSSECIQNRIQLSSISILHIAAALHLHVLTWSVPTPFWSRWPERSLLLCVCARTRQFWILQPWVLFGISKNSWEEAMQQNGATQCRASPTIFLAAENGNREASPFSVYQMFHAHTNLQIFCGCFQCGVFQGLDYYHVLFTSCFISPAWRMWWQFWG